MKQKNAIFNVNKYEHRAWPFRYHDDITKVSQILKMNNLLFSCLRLFFIYYS